MILKNQQEQGWGSQFIDHLSKDLGKSFPDMKGFSVRNLKYMRKFAEEYPEFEFVQATLAQITWYHNITMMEKVKNKAQRSWYLERTIENGWSRNVMVHQIESQLYERQQTPIRRIISLIKKALKRYGPFQRFSLYRSFSILSLPGGKSAGMSLFVQP